MSLVMVINNFRFLLIILCLNVVFIMLFENKFRLNQRKNPLNLGKKGFDTEFTFPLGMGVHFAEY